VAPPKAPANGRVLPLQSMVSANIARRQVARAFFVLLLLTLFTGLQTASAITEQIHHHDGPSHTDCCGVCHAGHLSVTQAVASVKLVLPDLQCWHEAQDAPPAPGEFVSSLHLSRAPPCLHS
jgi:hypothetical protein